jgi:hypothetical protein
MKIFAGRLHFRAVAMAFCAAILSFWFFASLTGDAAAQGQDAHSDLEHHHGFTGPGDEADWPPRPTGASESMFDADANLEPEVQAAPALRAIEEAAEAAEAAIDHAASMSTPLEDALGEDWIHISSVEAKLGKGGSTPSEETYFSRSNNQTVMVLNGSQVVTFTPTELQPVVSPAERAEASALGMAWLLEQGHDADGLEGFGIRALDHGELYPVRMVYVTFATSHFDDPLFSALVDLTNGVVVEGGAL